MKKNVTTAASNGMIVKSEILNNLKTLKLFYITQYKVDLKHVMLYRMDRGTNQSQLESFHGFVSFQ